MFSSTRFLAFLAMLWLALAGSAMAQTPIVSDVRVGQHPDHTRFVMEISGKVDFNLSMLADPYRVVVDFPEMAWQKSNNSPRMSGVLEGFRYGLFKPGTSRIVLDAKSPVKVKQILLLDPRGAESNYRFVMDLVPTSREQFMANLRPAAFPPAVVAKPAARQPAQVIKTRLPSFVPPRKPTSRDKYIVVIDAGHGGVDPGAIGISGIYEKQITLAAARQLRDRLARTGRYKPVLTRDRDIFIPLRERVAIARKAGADLFISLHADSISRRSVSGASVYTLSEKASDAEAAALAEKENKVDLLAGINLTDHQEGITDILIDLTRRDTMNQSARFAENLIDALDQRVEILRRGHRFAGFAVLKAPDVPSVLVEMGFLSNKQDEKALRRKDHREKIARSIVDAIDMFFDRIEEAESIR